MFYRWLCILCIARGNYSVRVYKALFHLLKFGYSAGYFPLFIRIGLCEEKARGLFLLAYSFSALRGSVYRLVLIEIKNCYF